MRLVFQLFFIICLQTFATIPAFEVYEDEATSLLFDVTLPESSSFSILFNGNTIFQNGSAVVERLSASQLRRYDVKRVNINGSPTVQLNISAAHEGDAGTYTLRLTSETGDLPISQDIDLVIFYAPSDPQCAASNNTLSCRATQGYPGSGEVSCYQGNQKLTPLSNIGGDQETIEAVYPYKPSDAISCCAESRTFEIPPEECSQFVIYPTTGQPSTSTDSKLMNQTDAVKTTEEIIYVDDWLYKNKTTLAFVGVLLFILLIIYPMGMFYHFRIHMRGLKKYVSDGKQKGHFTEL